MSKLKHLSVPTGKVCRASARLNSCRLPATFKIVPGSLFAIAQRLNQSEASLRSLMVTISSLCGSECLSYLNPKTLFSVARSQGLLGINAICDSLDTPLRIEGKALQLSYQTLLSGLLHSDEGISQAAFQLISRYDWSPVRPNSKSGPITRQPLLRSTCSARHFHGT